jgi:hypothetical protein
MLDAEKYFVNELSRIKQEAITLQESHQHKISEFLKAHKVDSVHCLSKVYPPSDEFTVYWHKLYNYHVIVSSSFIIILDVCEQFVSSLLNKNVFLDLRVEQEKVKASFLEIKSDFESKKNDVEKYEIELSHFGEYLRTLHKVELAASSEESWDEYFVGEFSILSSPAITDENVGLSEERDPFLNFDTPFTPRFDANSANAERQEGEKESKQWQNGNPRR